MYLILTRLNYFTVRKITCVGYVGGDTILLFFGSFKIFGEDYSWPLAVNMLTSQIFLNLFLKTLLYEGKITTSNFLNILIDVAWWLMELHNNSPLGTVYFSALDPSKIGLIPNKSTYNAYLMNFICAQGKCSLQFSSTVFLKLIF